MSKTPITVVGNLTADKPEAVFTVRYELRGVAQVRAHDQYAAECIAADHLIGHKPTEAVLDNDVRAVDASGWATTKTNA